MKSAELCPINQNPLSIEVATLKVLICRQHTIQEDNLILIANGGICIQDGMLSNYDCGDDETNPVFVYLRHQRRPPMELAEESSLMKEFHQILSRLSAVGKKSGSSLATLRDNEAMCCVVLDSSRQIKREIELSIRDQYLLVDGWNAAVANLSDSLVSIEKRIIAMKGNLQRFLTRDLQEGFRMMEQYGKRMSELEKVPLLSVLIQDSAQVGGAQLPVNLLQWVLYKDKDSMQSIMLEAHEAYCALVGITNAEEVTFEEVQSQWGTCGMVADVMKSILDGDELVAKCKPVQLPAVDDYDEERSLEEIHNHYMSNKSYMERLNYLAGVRERCDYLIGQIQSHREYTENIVKQCRDVISTSVLQDHCNNASTQLVNLSKHYSQMAEWLNKVSCSKNDLANNIDERKTWLMKYQTSIGKVDDSLFRVREKMKRVRAGCRILEQMGTAPQIYTRAVTEIRRRKQFLDMWYSWAAHCTHLSRELRHKDHELRRSIDHDLENHFIQSLFSSLHSFSLPKIGSSLLNSSPPILPHISDEDVSKIADSLPELVQFLQVHHISPECFHTIPKYPSNFHGEEIDPSTEKSQLILNKPANDSCVSLEEVSLMPVPDDIATHLEELYLSVHGTQSSRHLIDTAINAESSEEESSKMVRSINSMDFQLTNDKTTETGRDVVCLSRAVFDSMLLCIRDLRDNMEAVRHECHHHTTEQKTFISEAARLLTEIQVESKISTHEKDSGGATVGCYVGGSEVINTTQSGSTNTILITHKEFKQGNPVCFTSQMINGTLQWRMLSTDNRISYLHDDCIIDSSRHASHTRRDSAMITGNESNDVQSPVRGMAQSQNSPQITARSCVVPASIVWGTFISREEYISKKTSNRYGLPMNTKFFRVRANIDWPISS